MPKPDRQPVQFVCRVSLQDIESMFDSYESGMADFTTQNVVARALQPHLVPGARVSVHHQEDGSRWVEVEGYRFELPEDIGEWLRRSETNLPVAPFSFRVTLPAWLLAEATALPAPIRRGKQERLVSHAA